jgi:hypothetical protein
VLLNHYAGRLKSYESCLCVLNPVEPLSAQGRVIHICSKDWQLYFVELSDEWVDGKAEQKDRAGSAHIQTDLWNQRRGKHILNLWNDNSRGGRPFYVVD